MPAHTPGPWRVEKVGGQLFVRDDDDWQVCELWDTSPPDRDNARLIAAAPALLEALESIAKNTCCTSCQEAALVARAAIAQAKGETV